jgi:hypothetical protein
MAWERVSSSAEVLAVHIEAVGKEQREPWMTRPRAG